MWLVIKTSDSVASFMSNEKKIQHSAFDEFRSGTPSDFSRLLCITFWHIPLTTQIVESYTERTSNARPNL